MKPLLFSISLSGLLLAGCTAEEVDLTPPTSGASAAANEPGIAQAGLSTPPPTGFSALSTTPSTAATSASEAAPLVTNAEEKMELADYTEKVYLPWNAALTDFRQKQNRWPGSLQELQQFQPDLASFLPPRGFVLNLDKQADEIYLTRAAATQARTSTAPPPPANLTVPMAIP